MSKRAEVWALLTSRPGEWITRREIEQVGGYEGTRRLRELRGMAFQSGWLFDQRKGEDGTDEYRVRTRDSGPDTSPIQRGWNCAKCGSLPANYPQPSTDLRDRWRIAWCMPCGNKKAIFTKET
jgi:hypothetical protein